MRLIGVGWVSDKYSLMAPPRPPVIWASSTVMMRLHCLAMARIVVVSNGLIVWQLMTAALMCLSCKRAAAWRHWVMIGPVPMMAMSVPCLRIWALPI